jgi:hypothetical protein
MELYPQAKMWLQRPGVEYIPAPYTPVRPSRRDAETR